MSEEPSPVDWLEAELAEALDEDLELEMSEPAMSLQVRRLYEKARPSSISRETYFRELLRLQAELINLQDWVIHTGAKLLVIFEGRDAAGKGGVEFGIALNTGEVQPGIFQSGIAPRFSAMGNDIDFTRRHAGA